ncbi:MAG: efflux RND transporter permease subunit, partial [Planctomycetales bacterium]|nr:efflux RND transporter permease subunit [Planctomycetales bacterium]
YMPTLFPAASFSEAMRILQTQDARIREIPEVADVLGKIGRAESALDPAPAAMVETYVMLKPRDQWRPGVTALDIWEEINRVATLPGVTPATPLQPIEGRVVMLQSGIKAPMAIRIYGDSLAGLAEASLSVADTLRESGLVNPASVNPDIVMGKPYIEFTVDRERSARYGMSTQMVNQVIETALGGTNVTTTFEGRERYPIQIRYQRSLREQLENVERVPIVSPSGAVIPLETLATKELVWGPGLISSENARLVAHVAFAPTGALGDLETVQELEETLRVKQANGELKLPAGYSLEAVGSFQNQIEANQRLLFIVPLVIAVNLLLIYLEFRDLVLALIIFLQIPVAFAGGMIGVAWLGIEMNTAIWVGFIALFGISVDDGIVIATYMRQRFESEPEASPARVRELTIEAGKRRIRPCLMTAATTFAALLPVMLADGRGADVARAMAIPVFAGMFVELVSLFVVPVIYCGYREWQRPTTVA